MKLSSVVPRLAEYCNVHLAEPWDNVGLLVEPSYPHNVKNVIVTNDLTLNVMEESIKRNADLIISYHPPIFKPLKKVTQDNWKEKIVGLCFKHGIAVYSPHTGLDAKVGGINDWLLSPFEIVQKYPIKSLSVKESVTSARIILDNNTKAMCAELNLVPKSIKANGDVKCAEISIPKSRLDQLNGWVESQNTSIELLNTSFVNSFTNGSGRIGLLKHGMSTQDLVNRYKELFEIEHLKVALGHGKSLEDKNWFVGVCAGSGGSFLTMESNINLCDIFITGEASHHEQLEAVSKGCTVITVGHSVSERNYLKTVFVPWLGKEFSELDVSMSACDKEPGDIM